MKHLNIPDKGIDSDSLEFPLNDWLAQHRDDVLARASDHPNPQKRCPTVPKGWADGVVFANRFLPYDIGRLSVASRLLLAMEDRGLKVWLLNEGDLKEEDVELIIIDDMEADFCLRGTNHTGTMLQSRLS